ncbi:MAG: hypothetical protein HYR55_13600 [Acidobacteria bacterium]|nr:hypothetical protein [Acidobacteriota bacterium]MBI3658142.1 hypothetical protein [Acidobacteriota bacterium]
MNMKWKLAPRERKMVIGGGLLAAILVAVYFVIMPFLDYKQAVSRDIKNKSETLKQYLHTKSEKESLQARKEELNRRMEKAAAKLLNETVPTAAANQLQVIVDGLVKGVEIQTRRPGKEERLKEDYQRVSTQLDFQCQIDQLIPVLYEIKNYDQGYLCLDNLDITYQQYAIKAKDTKVKPLRVALTLSAIIRYVAPEKKEDKDSGRVKTPVGAAKA